MKYSLIISLMLLSSCTQLMKGAEQPVTQYRDVNTFRTTCSGAAENWSNCNQKANRTCTNGYNIVEKIVDSNAVHRELIFRCKK